jgi:hypothetical protein
MRAKLKQLESPDIDLESFWPQNVDSFGFPLRAMIGPEGEDGEESFDFFVCTPDWLKSHHEKTAVIFARHLLIVFEYDISKIRNHISRYCERCIGEDWQDIATKLARVGRWEFEDYLPYSSEM